jgi:type II secretory pathway pseudopilin PulG
MNEAKAYSILHKRAAGFSYTEMLVATFLIAIVLAPTLESLTSGIQSSSLHYARATDHYRLTGKLEEVLASSFDELEQEADAAGGPSAIVIAYSDPAGTQGRRLVNLARYDGDNADLDNDPFTGADEGLLWVQVQLEDSSAVIHTLTSE